MKRVPRLPSCDMRHKTRHKTVRSVAGSGLVSNTRASTVRLISACGKRQSLPARALQRGPRTHPRDDPPIPSNDREAGQGGALAGRPVVPAAEHAAAGGAGDVVEDLGAPEGDEGGDDDGRAGLDAGEDALPAACDEAKDCALAGQLWQISARILSK